MALDAAATSDGWSCTTLAVGGTGSITCTDNNPIVVGQSDNFTFVFHVSANVANGSTITNTASVNDLGPRCTEFSDKITEGHALV